MTTSQALSRMRAKQATYRRMFECAADAMLLIDAGTFRIEEANEAATLLYDYARRELVGMDVRDLSAERAATEEALARLKRGEGQVVLLRRHRRRDGGEFPVEIHASAFASGKRRVIIAAVRDLSEQDEARRALGESENRFREMAENITQVFWMTDPSKSKMLYVSPAYESIWGRTCASLYAAPRSWLDAIHPEDRSRVREALSAQADGGYEETYRIIDAAGRTRWIFDRGFPIRDESGKIARIAGVAKDVTERKLAEDERAAALELLERAQEVAGIGSWSFDVVTGRVVWSPESCRIFGVESTPVDAEGYFALVHPEDRERARAAVAAALAAGDFRDELRVVRPDGAVRWMQVYARIARDADGKPLRMIGIVQDVTKAREERRKLQETEQQLRQAQKMEAVGRLAGGVAHDFNNILTAILGLAEMGAASLAPKVPLRADLEEIRACALRAANLTSQLLAFSRRQIIAPRVIELDDTVLGLSRMLRRVIGEDIVMRVAPGAKDARVMADPGQLEQLVMNLAVNSRDAMPEGGSLVISSERARVDGALAQRLSVVPGDYVVLSVADDGCGMTEEVRQHIFEPFFTTKGLGKGTGLGLATCYGIVTQNKGAIDCRSTPGAGTTFRIYLPEERRPAATATPPELEAQPRGREYVLVVEDEEPVRRLVRRVLEKLGYEVTVSSDGRAALETLRADEAGRIRLVVSDMVMPVMSGRGMAEELAKLRPGLPVLFTTGYTDDTVEVPPGLELLRKPFSGAELARRVRGVLDRPAS